jgi:hypothetical protein
MVIHKVKQTVHPTMILGLPNLLNQSDTLAIVVCFVHDMPHEQLRLEVVEGLC